MATQDDSKPSHPLVLLQARYVALCDVLWDHLGHDNSALPLLQGLNDEFERLVDDLCKKGALS